MAERTFYFFGVSISKDNFIDDTTLMTQRFWDSLVSKFIEDTDDETAKKYAMIARDYIVYSKYSSDYNPLSQKAYAYVEFMSERHVAQYKKLTAAIFSWADEKYGMKIQDEHVATFPEDICDLASTNGNYVLNDVIRGFKYNIPQQLGYIS